MRATRHLMPEMKEGVYRSVARGATEGVVESVKETFGLGRKTVRATGWKPVRRAASRTSTETAP